jgi:hypothetical protein
MEMKGVECKGPEVSLETTNLNLDSVSQERIYVTNLNHYVIHRFKHTGLLME